MMLVPVDGGDYEVIKQEIPLIDATFVGTGDLFAALLLVWLEKTTLAVILKPACISDMTVIESLH